MLNQKEKVLLYSNNLWLLGEGMLGPLFAVYAAKIGGSLLNISWAWATYLVAAGVLTMVVGRLTDGYLSKEKTLVAGFGLNAVCTFSYLFVTSPQHLFLVQAGFGVALALATPTWYALYAKHENRRRGATVWGLAKGQSLLLNGIAILIGGVIVSKVGFEALFITMGIIQTSSTLVALRLLRR